MNSWPFTSQALVNFVVFYRRWQKDMHGSDWIDATANTCAEEWRFFVGWCLVVQVK